MMMINDDEKYVDLFFFWWGKRVVLLRDLKKIPSSLGLANSGPTGLFFLRSGGRKSVFDLILIWGGVGEVSI